MKKLLYFFLLAGTAIAQCNYTATISMASVSSPAFDNSSLKCNSWSFSYMSSGFTSVIVQLESTSDIVRVPFSPIQTSGNPSSTLAGSFSFSNSSPAALRVNLIYAKGNGSIFFTLTGSGSDTSVNFGSILTGTNINQSLAVGSGSVISSVNNGSIYATNLTRFDFSALPSPGAVTWQSTLIKDHYLETPCVITSLYCISNGSAWFQIVGPPGSGVLSGTTGQFATYASNGTVVGGHTFVIGDVPAGYSYSNLSNTASGVTAGTYGDSTHCANVTIGADGRITSATNSTSCPGTGGGGGAATSIISGTLSGLPSTCTTGAVYFATDQPANQQTYTCSATNTWTQGNALGGSGALVWTGGSLDVVTSIVPLKANANTFSGLNAFSVGQDMAEQASGSTPASGKLHIYANTDHTFHQVTSAGADSPLGSSSIKSVFAYQSAFQAIPGSYTATALSFDTNDSNTTNTPSMHSTTVNPDSFIVPSDGFYEGTCFVYSDSTAPATEVLTVILLNGTQIAPGRLGVSASNTFGNGTSFYYFMHTSDVVKCVVTTDSAWHTNFGLGGTEFYMHSVN
jgi:hypothetical protein